jgi:hypothetical protein
MWPWEHFAAGYIAYSLSSRILGDRVPTHLDASAVLVGSQFPDLIDKPGSWLFGLLPSGVSLAHSVFVSVPVTIFVIIESRRRNQTAAGLAFSTGYLSHLPGDALYGTITRGAPPSYRVFLWPIAPKTTNPPGGFLTNVRYYLDIYQSMRNHPNVVWFVVFEVLFLSTAFLLWIADGKPGVALLRDQFRDRWTTKSR